MMIPRREYCPPLEVEVDANDHCTFTAEQRRMGLGDFAKIPDGTRGLEDRMSVLWTEGVSQGHLTVNRTCCIYENPGT